MTPRRLGISVSVSPVIILQLGTRNQSCLNVSNLTANLLNTCQLECAGSSFVKTYYNCSNIVFATLIVCLVQTFQINSLGLIHSTLSVSLSALIKVFKLKLVSLDFRNMLIKYVYLMSILQSDTQSRHLHVAVQCHVI